MKNKVLANEEQKNKILDFINRSQFLDGYMGLDQLVIVLFGLGIVTALISGINDQLSDIVVYVYFIILFVSIVTFIIYRKKQKKNRISLLTNGDIYLIPAVVLKNKKHESNPTASNLEPNGISYYLIVDINGKKIKKRVHSSIGETTKVGDIVYLVFFTQKDQNLVVKL